MNRKLRICLALGGQLALAAPAAAMSVHISEVLYDAAGSDDGNVFVELYGSAGQTLDGWRIEGVNGSGGSVGPVLALVGAIPGDGFFVVADGSAGSTSVANADLLLDFDFQNGPDSIVLVGPDDAVVDALGYGAFGAGDVFAGEGSSSVDPPAGQSLARLFADLDTDDNAVDFGPLETPTPGSGALQVAEPTRAGLLALIVLLLCARGAKGSPSTVR